MKNKIFFQKKHTMCRWHTQRRKGLYRAWHDESVQRKRFPHTLGAAAVPFHWRLLQDLQAKLDDQSQVTTRSAGDYIKCRDMLSISIHKPNKELCGNHSTYTSQGVTKDI